MSDLTVRPVRTAFDPADGPVTVATPSCCCSCCCCCLATTALAVSATISAGHHAAEERRRSGALPVLLGLAAIPAAIAAASGVANIGLGSVGLGGVAAAVTYAAICALMFLTAGVEGEDLARAAGLAVALGAGFLLLFVVEAVVAIFTVFLIELAAFVTLFLGWRLGRWWAGSTPRPDSPWQQWPQQQQPPPW